MAEILIGLNGFKQVGKDTAANFLVEEYGFQKRSFAYPLKQAVATLLGIHTPVVDTWKLKKDIKICVLEEDNLLPKILVTPCSMREFLQRMGTEVGREQFGENFWLDQLLPYPFIPFVKPTVITDVRFENELRRVKHCGGINIRIERPETNEKDIHKSEMVPNPELIDLTIYNSWSIKDFYGAISNIMRNL